MERNQAGVLNRLQAEDRRRVGRPAPRHPRLRFQERTITSLLKYEYEMEQIRFGLGDNHPCSAHFSRIELNALDALEAEVDALKRLQAETSSGRKPIKVPGQMPE